MGCYAATKNEEILSFVITQVDLEDILLSEIKQSQKDKCFPLICGVLRVI